MRFYIALLFFVSCAISSAADKPNILFLLADDQRPDTISALGNDRIETPNLDKLVARGTTFTRATCSYPICVISRAEILSGMHGWENGVNAIDSNTFRDGITFWGDALQAAGYDSWYVGKWHTSGRPFSRGYNDVNGLYSGGGGKWWKEGQTDWKGFPITGYRGWIFQSEDGKEKFPDLGVGLTPDIDAKFADAAIELIERDQDKPWFLHVNFTAPHDPLFIPPGYEGKYKTEEMQLPENFAPEHPFDHGNLKGRDETLMHFPRTPEATRDVLRVYYAVIDHLDKQVGRILDALDKTGQLENTIVIYTSDHGMGVGSHGLRGKQSMYEHTINVPFVIAGPGIEAGRKTPAQIYLRELYPTTCDLVGAEVPKNVTAKSFAPVIRGDQDEHHEVIYGYFRDSQRMIRNDRWKYIVYPQVGEKQLFDLTNDPNELNDLAEKSVNAKIVAKLDAELQKWRKEVGDPILKSD